MNRASPGRAPGTASCLRSVSPSLRRLVRVEWGWEKAPRQKDWPRHGTKECKVTAHWMWRMHRLVLGEVAVMGPAAGATVT